MSKPGKITVYTKEQGPALGDLFGIFFEDINHAADGGLYAEMVRNRSFEFDPIDRDDYDSLLSWEPVELGGGKGSIIVEQANPIHPRNPNYVAIEIIAPGEGVGIKNLGFNSGLPYRQGETYRFSMYARRSASFDEAVAVRLEGIDGTLYGEAKVFVTSEWEKYEVELASSATDFSGRLSVVTTGTGTLYLDMISLFPAKTFRGRSNGLREDIAELLAELKPKFMRFPGGCLIHDGSLNADDRNSMYRWKNTIGPVEQRPPRRNNWRYHQTLGLGYLEYFQLCEDISAKPIPILPAGYDPHHQRIVPIDELGPWIDDALDLIEFANGDVSTEWGGVRARLGHPEPFNLEYIGIGNEEVGEPFFERYTYFHQAIKSKYPDIQIINSSGPFAAGGEYERGWRSARENGSDFVDEHYYQSPDWFLAHYRRYASFKADDPKVFLGEYASWGNKYYNALVEAAFMTGLENNAHAVGLACYAPLLCNVDYVNWKPDMIWYNNHQAFGMANYYIQKLFMNHQGDRLLHLATEGFEEPVQPPDNPEIIGGKLLLGANLNEVVYRDVRLVNHETGEEKELADQIELSEKQGDPRKVSDQGPQVEVGKTDWSSYSLRLKAKRTSGTRGFNLYFGHRNEADYLLWDAGSWANQDTMLIAAKDGLRSCLTQSLFTIENGVEYDLELRVEGRTIQAYIDGELINETVHIPTIIESLYCSSSIEEGTGDIIVKAVNVQDVEVEARIQLADMRSERLLFDVYEMAGHALDAMNSFEEPEKIVPKHESMLATGNQVSHVFPKHSVTVFRFRGK
ncbi:alpha-L-arabinofuranosidase C-terminal domain-containing protein [Paenibacillus sp. LHD-117]|uniref:alpha-L-arabinofuranosidase C-terminal domain-containing protein n=1 Tax=Paenibacillus sp. LHD-117 TaxID=3071412 RepID=UPI0027E1BE83|nr:alpha-L-arabinofuranosidase C-terminal domain-containing protein [Paenibacillus sp. LHD-117]MDQ6417909.1 alpha-L-arabinofuranosidase C-terminal domain-containing protein [Paenibacillus sp. LHD-117]